MQKINHRRSFVILACFLLSAAWAPARESSADNSAVEHAGKNRPKNILFLGHALHHETFPLKFYLSDGRRSGQNPAKNISGEDDAWFQYENASNPADLKCFDAGKTWDAVIMTGVSEASAPKLAALAFKNNPQCRIFIWANRPTFAQSATIPDERAEAGGEKIAAAVNAAFPDAPRTCVIPCAKTIRELGRMAERGELPGIGGRYELAEGVGYPSRIAAYAMDTMVMAMLNQESPLNYPAEICVKSPDGKRQSGPWNIQLPDDTALAIRRLVWDVLLTYPPSGMPPCLAIANRHLEPVIAGQPCKIELQAVHADGPCAWSLVKGALPNGLSLSREGLLVGKSDAVGNYPLFIRLADGRQTDERPLVLTVSQDISPSISDQSLKSVPLDEYVAQSMKVSGGVGTIVWSVSGGQLPHGVILAPNGTLLGSPGESGPFSFTIKAEDSFPGAPRSAEKKLTWNIDPATPEALQVKSLEVTGKADDRAWTFDGKLDEPFWKLDQTIARKTAGTPTKQASFGAVWTCLLGNDKKMRGDSLVLAVKVLDGPKGKTSKDGVHIFVDGVHNRSAAYAIDDSHYFVSRNGSARAFQQQSGWYVKSKAQEIEGGYTLEISLSAGSFSGEGTWVPFGPRSIYGLDVAVDEGDDKEISQQVWHGDANDAEDTSHFGMIVLTSQPVIGTEPTLMPTK